MPYFPSTGTAHWLYFSCLVRWEIMRKNEFIVPVIKCIVYQYFIVLCSQCQTCERLRFTSGKNSRTMSRRQVIYLNPYRSHLICFTSVNSPALIDHKIPD